MSGSDHGAAIDRIRAVVMGEIREFRRLDYPASAEIVSDAWDTLLSRIASLEGENAELKRALEIWDKSFETGRTEPLYIARDHARRLQRDLLPNVKPDSEEG